MKGRLTMSREIDWDKTIIDAEADFRRGLWNEASRLSAEEFDVDERIDEILDQIEEEAERVSPTGECAIDQEEVWRFTGQYPTFINGKEKDK